MTFRFAALDKLPVAMRASTRHHTIAEEGAKGFRLAAADAKDGVVGRCLLVTMQAGQCRLKDVAVTLVLSASELRRRGTDLARRGRQNFHGGYPFTARGASITNPSRTRTRRCCSSPVRCQR